MREVEPPPEPWVLEVFEELVAEPLVLPVDAVALRPLVREVVGGDGVRPEVLVRARAAAVALVVPPVLTTRFELAAEPLERRTAGEEVWRGTLRELRTRDAASSLSACGALSG